MSVVWCWQVEIAENAALRREGVNQKSKVAEGIKPEQWAVTVKSSKEAAAAGDNC